jgi:hypothetical protein
MGATHTRRLDEEATLSTCQCLSTRLLWIYLIVPDSSFVGHLCGILAGESSVAAAAFFWLFASVHSLSHASITSTQV